LTLALYGGKPVRTRPWVSKFIGGEELGQEERERVLRVLAKKRIFRYLPEGLDESETAQLEREYAGFVGTKYALAVNSGTSALICALIGVGVGPGDEVLIPAYTWIATAGAVVAVGAVPVLCEIDDSLTIDPEDLAAKITPHTKAVIVVHMRGMSCDMERILAVARAHNLKVVEDVAQANGGSFQGRRLGSFGDAGCFSLQQSKVITTGEGGMLVTNSEEVWQRAVIYHDGAMYQFRFTERKIPAFAGQNYRLTELQAALSLGQIEKMPALIDKIRAVKRQALDVLQGQAGISFSPAFGSERDLGVSLVFYAKTTNQAAFLERAITAEGIPAQRIYDSQAHDQHVYVNWEFLMQKQDPWGGHFPWDQAFYKGSVEYRPDICPKTLDLLGRAVQIRLNQLITDEDLADLAAAVAKAVAAMPNEE
jgi:dTDP-4-amino-4,6-dideoxygalactose transaminase